MSDFKEWREIPSTTLDRLEMREVLIKAFESLAPEYREVFVAHDVQRLLARIVYDRRILHRGHHLEQLRKWMTRFAGIS
jgi:hypothetical protein